MKAASEQPIGFIGIGVMGLPMARNLLASGVPLAVWNRTPGKCRPLQALGARLAPSPSAVFEAADLVILMLATGDAIDQVLHRGTPAFAALVQGHTVIHMGTTAPAYSMALAADITAAGGRYAECPVSGSRRQAEDARLIGLLAGEPELLDELRPLLAPMLGETFICGPVPSALLMKLAINLFLITTVTGLCETFHFAATHGLALRQFQAIVNAGPMASAVSINKLRKLVDHDDAVEASIDDVLNNNRLIADAARQARIASPLLDACHALFEASQRSGRGLQDMTAVLQAIQGCDQKPLNRPPDGRLPFPLKPPSAAPG